VKLETTGLNLETTYSRTASVVNLLLNLQTMNLEIINVVQLGKIRDC